MGSLEETFRRLAADVAENLSFFTRLPVNAPAHAPDFRRIGWAAPLAGAAIGAIGGLTLIAARAMSLPSHVSATLAVIAMVLLTGALHEDGIADVADGFGGGRDREAKLAILRDSRIGSYGAVALALSLFLRITALAALTRGSALFGAAALTLAAAAARGAALGPLAWLPPARADGAGASVGALGAPAILPVVTTLAALAAALGFVELGVVRALFAVVVAAGVTRLFIAMARAHIGGQTGDVCGAAAGLAEAATLIALLVGGRDA